MWPINLLLTSQHVRQELLEAERLCYLGHILPKGFWREDSLADARVVAGTKGILNVGKEPQPVIV